MPYQAAKAMAATFCYNIRHALTPVFGKEFLSMCTPPKDPSYAKFQINPAIVEECTADTKRWLEEAVAGKNSTPAPEKCSTISTPTMNFACPPWSANIPKSHRSKPSDLESGYGTDTDQSDKYFFSPQVSPRSQAWTSVNRSQSPTSPPVTHFTAPQPWLSSLPSCFHGEQLRTKRTLSKVVYGSDKDENQDHTLTEPFIRSDTEFDSVCVDTMRSKLELDAAEIMLSLSVADAGLHRTKRTRRGSKY
jgi:hypothetical protein